ncbi:mechanosensitive ion channel protein MscS [Photobacterium swingsii]|uniref:Small-conductance mechanosensitive channel n=1 Tax=Photobacterium swingsii TaxID=680026 RepID=A0A0J8V9M1_9GAMM|nr:mechanosensitive ion channel family protein [Photobacterium swingsii]KMV29852.1 mechanosensitive ion channel protein MscS [Photobacterium swingsii]PSW26067.1 mechanosensitive ion channel protein MscS [Photobacterium swingsii]
MRLICILLLMFSSWVWANTEETSAAPPDQKPAAITQIKTLNTELKELLSESKTSTGSAQNVVSLQLINKNEELREVIADLVNRSKQDDETIKPYHSFVLEQVNYQVKFIEEAIVFLTKKVNADEQKLDTLGDEQKLLTQKKVQEIRSYIQRLLSQQWTNYHWLADLGIDTSKQKNALVNNIEHKLEYLSASLTFNSQQEQTLNKQLKAATESEKGSLQLLHILSERQLASDLTNMQAFIKLADQMSVDTADYKKQIFEQTGNVTNDLLNVAVLLSIVRNNLEDLSHWVVDNAPQMLFKLFVFIIIIAVFRILKNITSKMVKKAVSSPNLRMSQLMQEFFVSMSGKGVFCIGLLIALSQIGLDLTPILTGFGVAGVIIGFALQDTLSNFASGMMLLIYRPFDVGDFVEAGGVSGKVSHMSLVSTTIKTFDNQILIVPNSKIWGDTIKNVTHERVRRVDMIFGIGYSDDLELAEKVFNDIIDEHPMVLRQPEKTIKLHTLNTSSVDYIVRPWVKTEDYWDVYWDVTREVKRRFDEVGLSIPFPQQDVHLHVADAEAASLAKVKRD